MLQYETIKNIITRSNKKVKNVDKNGLIEYIFILDTGEMLIIRFFMDQVAIFTNIPDTGFEGYFVYNKNNINTEEILRLCCTNH